MQHRDYIAISKVISEMQVGIDMLGDTSLESFLENEMMKRALGMTCINVGELIKVVTDETRKKYQDFPWRQVAGMRDITAHRYQTLKMEDVYNTVKTDYPELIKKLKDILSQDYRC